MSINPYYMAGFQAWASFMVPTLERFGPVPNPPIEDGWKNWASDVVSLDGLLTRNAPSPFGFVAWQDWAARLIEVVDDGF